jgi:uncharacterized protein (UPF0332 family)
MNDAEVLFQYRREQALLTLQEAEKMLVENFSPRTIINRAYYAMFYMTLSLFIYKGISYSTSKHTGIISLFDKEFILTNLIERKHSKALHKMFDRRIEFDYKDFVHPMVDDAREGVTAAHQFIDAIEAFINIKN